MSDNFGHSVMAVICLAGAGVCFVLGAMDSGIAGLPKVVAGIALLLAMYHFVKLGRLY